jgi:hypothetical protein
MKEERMGRACRKPGRQGNHIRSLVGKREVKKPFRRFRHELENTKMDLKETRREDADWIRLAQDRDQCWVVVNMVINIRVP